MITQELSEERIRRGLDTQLVGREVHYYPVVASTQDAAREAARVGTAEGAVFIADEQTAGRGRLGRRWRAPSGSSLLLSVILRPSAEVYPKLGLVGSLATALAIEEITGLGTELKWPNDVLLRGKKVAGVLVEGEFRGTTLLFAVLGVGVNVNLDPQLLTDVLYLATSLSAEVGAPVSRVALAQSLLRHLDRALGEAAAGAPIHQRWRARLTTLGKEVRVRVGQATEEGLAETVDADGNLLLRRRDGSLVTIVAGDVTL